MPQWSRDGPQSVAPGSFAYRPIRRRIKPPARPAARTPSALLPFAIALMDPKTLRHPFRDENRLDLLRLHEHMLTTYFNLRVCTGIVALLLPLVLWLGGAVGGEGGTLLESMSAYYHTDLRGVFVGALLFVGTILFVYRGYSDLENVALNVAGVLAYGVAAFPAEPPEGVEAFSAPYLHGVSAVSFFLCIAYVCVYRSRDTLDFVRGDEARARYTRLYRVLGTLMVVLPLAAAALLHLLERTTIVFWVEFAAVWVFGTYWIVKSVELRRSTLPALSESAYRAATRDAA